MNKQRIEFMKTKKDPLREGDIIKVRGKKYIIKKNTTPTKFATCGFCACALNKHDCQYMPDCTTTELLHCYFDLHPDSDPNHSGK